MASRRIPVATVVAGGLLAAGVAAAGALTATGALAAAGTPAPSATSAPGKPGEGPGPLGGPRGGRFAGPRLGFGGRVLHGEAVVPGTGGSGTQTVLVQKGTISAKSGNDLTVKSSDGFTMVWTLNSSTTVRTGWSSGSVKDLAVGDAVSVTGTKSGSGGTARFVAEPPKGTANGSRNAPGWRRGGHGRPGTTSPSPTTAGAAFGNV